MFTAPKDTFYSHMNFLMLSECISMDLTTYLIRQGAATMRENIKSECTKSLVALFSPSTTNFVYQTPWEQLSANRQQTKPSKLFGSHAYLKLNGDMWTYANSSKGNDEVLQISSFEQKFERYISPVHGSYYTSMVGFYQWATKELLQQYDKIIDNYKLATANLLENYNNKIDSYKKEIEKTNKWELDCLAICMGDAESEQLTTINLQECFKILLDTIVPGGCQRENHNVCSNIEFVHPKLHEETLNRNNEIGTIDKTQSAPIDTVYSYMDFTMLSDCVGMDPTTYLIRQGVATMKENVKLECIKNLVKLFSSYTTKSIDLTPWEQLSENCDKKRPSLLGFTTLVKLQKDVWTFQVPQTHDGEVISAAVFERKFKRYISPVRGYYYTSMDAFYQWATVDLVQKYKNVICNYKEQIEKIEEWEIECFANCNNSVKANEQTSINLQECFSILLDKSMPLPANEIVKEKTASICSKLEAVHSMQLHEGETKRNSNEGTCDGTQLQQAHVNNNYKHPPVIDLTTTPTKKQRVAVDQTMNTTPDTQMEANEDSLSSMIEMQEETDIKPGTLNPPLSMNQPKKSVLTFEDPVLELEAVYLDRPTHTELLELIHNECYKEHKYKKGSYIAMCLRTLNSSVEFEATSIPTRYRTMIAHLALRLFDFSGSAYVDKYRKMIDANDIWEPGANFSKLNAANLATITWVKATTPSLFLTDELAQEKFHAAFLEQFQ